MCLLTTYLIKVDFSAIEIPVFEIKIHVVSTKKFTSYDLCGCRCQLEPTGMNYAK